MRTVEPRYKNIGYSSILGSTIGLAGTDLVHTNYYNIPYIRILLAICSSLSENIVVTSLITLLPNALSSPLLRSTPYELIMQLILHYLSSNSGTGLRPPLASLSLREQSASS
jgi:hypothetical protein